MSWLMQPERSNGTARQAALQTRPPVEQAETPRDVVFVSSEVSRDTEQQPPVGLQLPLQVYAV